MVIKRRTGGGQALDKLHKGVVLTCVGLTAYGMYLLGWRFYRYFTVIKPNSREAELKMIQNADGGDDKAPTLKT